MDKLRGERPRTAEIVLTVKDEAGQVVRRLSAPGGQGLHRVAWDLRYPAIDPSSWNLGAARMGRLSAGPARRAGTYSVGMAKRVDGALTPIANSTFAVESLGLASLLKGRAALLAFQKKAGELQRAMLGAGARRAKRPGACKP